MGRLSLAIRVVLKGLTSSISSALATMMNFISTGLARIQAELSLVNGLI